MEEWEKVLPGVAVSDYWKRRYEQEKQLWEERLASKEKEKLKLREHFQQEEQGLRELTFRLRELEQRLEWEKLLWEERFKVKALEAELEKKKSELEAKVKILEQENEQLKIRLRAADR